MCGISGILRFQRDVAGDTLRTWSICMSDQLRHRGPDDEGVWVDATVGIALAHRRLSILDLSPMGKQPMTSHTGRFVIVFNGEIYNFADLRSQLASVGHSFRGRSDTEVLLAGFEEWGVKASLERAVGMFAFALWDAADRRLFLARDRMGEKPLYYGLVGATLVFASELKAIVAYPGFDCQVDRGALALFLRHNCIPAPYSIYESIRKLRPGHFVVIGGATPTYGEPQAYWDAAGVAEQAMAEPFRGTEAEAVAELERLLRVAVRGQMVADVPLGAFLSGGVDSSTIVALMQDESVRPVRTFTIGFDVEGYNEAKDAAAVAHHLGTDHTDLYVSPKDALELVPRLPSCYDEPFADSSQIPTFLVARLARQHVTVSLSGDGGDELFGGYRRYLVYRKAWERMRFFPGRRLLVHALRSPRLRGMAAALFKPLLGGTAQVQASQDLEKLAEVLSAGTADDVYRSLISHWKMPTDAVIGATEPPTLASHFQLSPAFDDFTRRMMFLDALTYLADDILVKVDRAAMAVSLETRVPMLDHRIVEFAWKLPVRMNFRKGQGKWLLRQVLYKYVPTTLIDRSKAGFAVPLHEWLRGPLRDWAEDLLDEARMRQDGFLVPIVVRQRWQQFLAGSTNAPFELWDVLMFQAWLQGQTVRNTAAPGVPPPASEGCS